VGVSVDPLGEPLGASVFPDGFIVVFDPLIGREGLFLMPAAFPVVVPFIDEPVVAAGPPAAELPPGELPLLCASANVLDSANALAKTIAPSFIVGSSRVC
jgi:hypothetical protein